MAKLLDHVSYYMPPCLPAHILDLARVLSIASKTTASLIGMFGTPLRSYEITAAGDAAKWQELVVVAAEVS